MKYKVEFGKVARRELKKMDKGVAKIIFSWIEKNLVDTTNPRQHGKGLVANKSGFWRYRVGNYRLLATIHDDKLVIELVEIAHRSIVYKPKK